MAIVWTHPRGRCHPLLGVTVALAGVTLYVWFKALALAPIPQLGESLGLVGVTASGNLFLLWVTWLVCREWRPVQAEVDADGVRITLARPYPMTGRRRVRVPRDAFGGASFEPRSGRLRLETSDGPIAIPYQGDRARGLLDALASAAPSIFRGTYSDRLEAFRLRMLQRMQEADPRPGALPESPDCLSIDPDGVTNRDREARRLRFLDLLDLLYQGAEALPALALPSRVWIVFTAHEARYDRICVGLSAGADGVPWAGDITWGHRPPFPARGLVGTEALLWGQAKRDGMTWWWGTVPAKLAGPREPHPEAID